MRLDEVRRIRIAHLPTALDGMPRLAKRIGLDCLLIKRDDNTGLALGGNKARKLEYLMADALEHGADVVLTCGGAQSNHARMTAAAAAKLGLDRVLFLTDAMPPEFQGNLMLDAILGAEMRFLPGADLQRLESAMADEEARLIAEGRKPYVIPMGGSTAVGAVGYVSGVRELAGQLKELGIADPDIVVALGSAGTTAGVVLGCDLFLPHARCFGISVSRRARQAREMVERLVAECAELLGIGDPPNTERLSVHDEYVGEGYAIPTDGGREAILMTARNEGVILDPVYTGKAMAGLMDLARRGVIGRGRPVVFWHTGGAGGLFAFETLFHDEGLGLSR